MEERLKLFLAMEGLSPSQFADKLGVQRSGVSHLLSGRNKPSFEFISKMLVAYPKLNPDWLIMGTGKAYRDMPGSESSSPEAVSPAAVTSSEDPALPNATLEENSINASEPDLFATSAPVVKPDEAPQTPIVKPSESRPKAPAQPVAGEKRIAQITILYTDGSYEVR